MALALGLPSLREDFSRALSLCSACSLEGFSEMPEPGQGEEEMQIQPVRSSPGRFLELEGTFMFGSTLHLAA